MEKKTETIIKCSIHWALKFIGITYFGLPGALGLEYPNAIFQTDGGISFFGLFGSGV